MEIANDKKMVSRVMKIVTTSQERLKLATEETGVFNYGDYVVEKKLVKLVLKKIITILILEIIDYTNCIYTT